MFFYTGYCTDRKINNSMAGDLENRLSAKNTYEEYG
jgi:hypothetical protein